MDTEAIGQQTYYPALKINGYLEEQLKLFEVVTPAQSFSPFMPVMSTSIDDIYGEILSTDATLPIVIAYDTLSRFRPNSFYRHKREQVLYTVHGPQDKVFAAIRIINAALDREDSAAQDVNAWASINQSITPRTSQDIFFHNIRTFQIDESRDLLELQSAISSTRPIYRNKIIVQYDYHTTDPLDALYT
jgi:hypothetical protein